MAEQNDVRWDRIEEAKWRIKTGYYDLPDVVEEVVDRLLGLTEDKDQED